jgi:hypothetical protein
MNFKRYTETLERVPELLYHATFGANQEVIEHYGLKPGNEVDMVCYPDSEIGVYLASDAEFAISFVEAAENENIPEAWHGDIIVFEVMTAKLDKTKLELDPHVNWDGSYSGEGEMNILPEPVGMPEHSQSFLYRGTISPTAFSFYEV